MTVLDRRRFALSLGVLSAGSLFPPGIAQAAALRVPGRRMRLLRELERSLNDGKQIVVRREWIVRFAANQRGISVAGQQVQVDVQAPKMLATLAQIERERPTDNRFPIQLGANGLITRTGPGGDTASGNKAVREARKLIRNACTSAAGQATAIRNLAMIQTAQGGLLDTMPPDLFFPACQTRRDSRKIAMPNGQKGEFVIEYASARSDEGAWLSNYTRKIVTRLARSERESRELWSMVPA